jgi:hypothetical protein
MLRAAGLPPWKVWRFSDYVGLTPQERLGLNTLEEVQKHYFGVEYDRIRVLDNSVDTK